MAHAATNASLHYAAVGLTFHLCRGHRTLVTALPPPARATEQRYIDQARHVMAIQENLTLRQKVIAEYWADGPKSWLPPGHWCSFALFVSERAHGLEQLQATVARSGRGHVLHRRQRRLRREHRLLGG